MTHKDLCKSPEGACYFPPLTAGEAGHVRVKQDEPRSTYKLGGSKEELPLSVLFARKGWWEGDFETLLSQLSSPDCAIPEPARSHLISTLLAHANDVDSGEQTPQPEGKHPPAYRESAWTHLSLLLAVIESRRASMIWPPPAVPPEPDPADPVRHYNDLFRQYLVAQTLCRRAHQRPRPSYLAEDMLHLAAGRLERVAGEVQLHPNERGHVLMMVMFFCQSLVGSAMKELAE
ncbi:hypothetical protein JCM10213v2_006346 [Rhodosporidiobolus nylandii]